MQLRTNIIMKGKKVLDSLTMFPLEAYAITFMLKKQTENADKELEKFNNFFVEYKLADDSWGKFKYEIEPAPVWSEFDYEMIVCSKRVNLF